MVYPIRREHAIQILNSLDPLLYQDLINILGLKYTAPSVRESLRVLACGNDLPSLAVLHKGEPRLEGVVSWDVHLVIQRDEHITESMDALPTDGKMYMFLNGMNTNLIPIIESRFTLQPDDSFLVQHYADDKAKLRVPPMVNGVVMLSKEHDQLIRAHSAPIVQHYWNACFGDWTRFRCFGLLRDGRVASFCAMGPCRDTNSVPTREIIFIHTEEPYRRRGFAKAALYRATQFIIEEGATAFYSVHSNNVAFWNTVKSMGYFECGRFYTYWAERS